MRLRRLAWIGAAGLLGLAALISIVALFRGDFTETDGNILATLGAAFLGGSLSLAGLALLDRRELVPLGWLAAVGGLVGFGVLAYLVWSGFDHEKALVVTLVLLPAGLMVTTARLLLRASRRLTWLYWACAALTSVAAASSVLAVLTEPESAGWAQLLGSVWILSALSWFLVPVLGRTADAPDVAVRERIVGRGPGRLEVDLAEGEVLVVRTAA